MHESMIYLGIYSHRERERWRESPLDIKLFLGWHSLFKRLKFITRIIKHMCVYTHMYVTNGSY